MAALQTLSLEELISTANCSALVTARSITDTIPASLSFFAVVGPTPSISCISRSASGKIKTILVTGTVSMVGKELMKQLPANKRNISMNMLSAREEIKDIEAEIS